MGDHLWTGKPYQCVAIYKFTEKTIYKQKHATQTARNALKMQ